jgi:hypothetical protein
MQYLFFKAMVFQTLWLSGLSGTVEKHQLQTYNKQMAVFLDLTKPYP